MRVDVGAHISVRSPLSIPLGVHLEVELHFKAQKFMVRFASQKAHLGAILESEGRWRQGLPGGGWAEAQGGNNGA